MPAAATNATPPQRLTLTATPKQASYVRAVLDDEYKYLAIGGAIRGGKTFGVLMALVYLARRYPRSRWAIVRRDLTTLRRNVMPALEKLRRTCSNFLGPMNQATWTAQCGNGSEILLFEEQADRDPQLERWHGLEVNGFVLEEADELQQQSWFKAIERAGAWVVPPPVTNPDAPVEQPPPKILCTFNPCDGWPREYFYEPYMGGTLAAPYFYQPATIEDNPYIGEEYKQSLLELPDDVYQRFVKGDWSITNQPNQLISSRWLIDAQQVEPVPGPQREGVDVAWYGGDWSVFTRMAGNTLTNIYGHHGAAIEDLAKLPGILLQRMAGVWRNPDEATVTLAPCNANQVWWDAVGVGAGGYSQLHLGGTLIRKFIAGAKPIPRRAEKPPLPEESALRAGRWQPSERVEIKFRTLKAQAWWECREKLRLKQVRIPAGSLDPRLREDLIAMRYKIDGEQFVDVESKDEFRKRTGRSSDWGDSFVMALFNPPANRQFTADDFPSLRW